VLGLDNAGKSTILASLADEDIATIMPTPGFSVKTVRHTDYELTVWDIGGQKAIRKYWKKYFSNTDAVVCFPHALLLSFVQLSVPLL
jgi:GTPase SAR1 family protein